MHDKTKKATVLLAILIAASFILLAKPTSAQSTPTPSMPQFTVELAGPSFDIPPTYSFNSTTGLFDANSGYHIQYSTVNIIIKNQPFTNQTNGDYLYYNVRIKPQGYTDSFWLELFSAGYEGFPIQTQTDTTTIPLPVEGAQVEGTTIPTGATTDIQVEAMIGHIGRNQTMTPYPYPYVFFGETSGWSNTETVTVPAKTPFPASPTLTPSASQTPSSNENSGGSITLPLDAFVIIVAALTLAILVLSVLLFRRQPKQFENIKTLRIALPNMQQ